MRISAVLVSLALSLCSIARLDGASAFASADSLKLTPSALVAESATAVTSGSLEAYTASLTNALTEGLREKSGVSAAKLASTPAGTLALLQWRLLTRLGGEGRAALVSAHPSTMSWLLGSREALEMFLTSGDVQDNRWTEATRVLCDIIASDAQCMDAKAPSTLPLRVAIATALVFAQPVNAMADGKPIDPVKRYTSFLAWEKEGVLFPTFAELSAWEMRYVVGSWSTDEDLVWARDNIKPELRVRDRVGDGAHMLGYNLTNKSGVSVQEGGKFYDNKPMTLAIMLEYGGVCGAISRFGTSMSQAFGVPAMPVGQPGHCAFIWQKTPHQWSINNDISGWSASGCHGGITIPWGSPAWFVPLMQVAQGQAQKFASSEVLRACAELGSATQRTALLEEAVEVSPQNYAAWQALLAAMTAEGKGATASEWKSIVKRAAPAFATHPPAYAMLLRIAHPFVLGAKATPASRKRFVSDAFQAMVSMQCGDGGLMCLARRDILVDQVELVVRRMDAIAKSKTDSVPAARALVVGEGANGALISQATALEVIDFTIDVTQLFDVAPSGGSHEAWAHGLSALISGIAANQAIREDGLARVQVVIAALMRSKREGDARWLADRIVEAAKATKDAEFEAKAAAYRSSLG